jgi:hypothetical protein
MSTQHVIPKCNVLLLAIRQASTTYQVRVSLLLDAQTISVTMRVFLLFRLKKEAPNNYCNHISFVIFGN